MDIVFIYQMLLATMDNLSFKSNIFEYIDKLKKVLENLEISEISDVIGALLDAYESEKMIYIFGNGGSAATASHFVCDFNKGISAHLKKKFKLVCLCDNIPTVTAIANDCGYENVFSMQLEEKLSEGDVIIAISGSGNSKNVIKAVEYAKERKCKIISMTGYDGGRLLQLSDHHIHISINNMQIVEDVHMVMCHLISSILAIKLGHPLC